MGHPRREDRQTAENEQGALQRGRAVVVIKGQSGVELGSLSPGHNRSIAESDYKHAESGEQARGGNRREDYDDALAGGNFANNPIGDEEVTNGHTRKTGFADSTTEVE